MYDIVLNHALCFLFSKIHKLEDRSSMLEFYTAVDIHEAKETLNERLFRFVYVNSSVKRKH